MSSAQARAEVEAVAAASGPVVRKRGRGRPKGRGKAVAPVKRVKREKKQPNKAAAELARLRWLGVPPDERKAHSEQMIANREVKRKRK